MHDHLVGASTRSFMTLDYLLVLTLDQTVIAALDMHLLIESSS